MNNIAVGEFPTQRNSLTTVSEKRMYLDKDKR